MGKGTFLRRPNAIAVGRREFLFRSPSDGVFFVNIRYMFNGDRLAFVKGYRRKPDKPSGAL